MKFVKFNLLNVSVGVEKISWCYKKDVHVNYYCEIPLMKNKI